MARWAMGWVLVAAGSVSCGGTSTQSSAAVAGSGPAAEVAGDSGTSLAGAPSADAGEPGAAGRGASDGGADTAGGSATAGAPTASAGTNGCGKGARDFHSWLSGSFDFTLQGAATPQWTYDGPAVVEAGTTAVRLKLAFDSQSTATGTTVHHVELDLQPVTQLFPVGAKLWLSVNPAGNWPNSDRDTFTPPLDLSLRTDAKGRVLLGASRHGLVKFVAAGSPAIPITWQNPVVICTARMPRPNCEKSGGEIEVSYQSIEVNADTPITIADGETKTIGLGGFDYDLSVDSRTAVETVRCPNPDYLEVGRFTVTSLYLRAKDLGALVGALPIEPPLL